MAQALDRSGRDVHILYSRGTKDRSLDSVDAQILPCCSYRLNTFVSCMWCDGVRVDRSMGMTVPSCSGCANQTGDDGHAAYKHIQSAAQDIQTHEEADVRVASCGGFRHFLCIKCQNCAYPTLRLGGDNIKLATHRLPVGGRGTCVATWAWRNRSHAIMPLALLHRVQVVIVRPTFRLCTCETTVRIRRNAEKGESE